MKKKEVFRAKIIQDANGFWRLIIGNNLDTISGIIPSKELAEIWHGHKIL